jgi:hypothetical protein
MLLIEVLLEEAQLPLQDKDQLLLPLQDLVLDLLQQSHLVCQQLSVILNDVYVNVEQLLLLNLVLQRLRQRALRHSCLRLLSRQKSRGCFLTFAEREQHQQHHSEALKKAS